PSRSGAFFRLGLVRAGATSCSYAASVTARRVSSILDLTIPKSCLGSKLGPCVLRPHSAHAKVPQHRWTLRASRLSSLLEFEDCVPHAGRATPCVHQLAGLRPHGRQRRNRAGVAT